MGVLDLHFIAFPMPGASAPASLLAARSALILPLAITGVLVVLATAYFVARRGLDSPAYKFRNLSPEKVAAYHNPDESPSAERLSESIIERATEIKNALGEEPSEIQTEMCAIGYRKCANDMITLTHLVNEELKEASITRRWRLKRARKRAIESLSEAREALPPDVLKATRQEK